jgi:hypothetical protein
MVIADSSISFGLVSSMVIGFLDLFRRGIQSLTDKISLWLLARTACSENSLGICEHLVVK